MDPEAPFILDFVMVCLLCLLAITNVWLAFSLALCGYVWRGTR